MVEFRTLPDESPKTTRRPVTKCPVTVLLVELVRARVRGRFAAAISCSSLASEKKLKILGLKRLVEKFNLVMKRNMHVNFEFWFLSLRRPHQATPPGEQCDRPTVAWCVRRLPDRDGHADR